MMISISIYNTSSLQSKPFSVQAGRAVLVLVTSFFNETMLLERDAKQLQQNLLTVTTQCTLNSTSQIHNQILWYPYLKT